MSDEKGSNYSEMAWLQKFALKYFGHKKSALKERNETKLAKSVYLLNLGDLCTEVHFNMYSVLLFKISIFNFLSLKVILSLNVLIYKLELIHP